MTSPNEVNQQPRCAAENRRQRAAYLLEIGYRDPKIRRTLKDEFKDCYKSDEQVYVDVHAVKTAKINPPNAASSTAPLVEQTLSPHGLGA